MLVMTGAANSKEPHLQRRVIWCMESISAIQDEDGRVSNYVALSRTSTNISSLESTIERLAYDPLTDLPDRRLLQQRLHAEWRAACTNDQRMALALSGP